MLGAAAAVDSPIAPIEDSVMQFQQNMSNPRGQNFARGQRLDWGWELAMWSRRFQDRARRLGILRR